MRAMKAKNNVVAYITKNGAVDVREEPRRELKDREVLVKIHASLISPGTETTVIQTRRRNHVGTDKDIRFGYSAAGEIVAVKGECGALKPGMRVGAMGGSANHGRYGCVPMNLVVQIPPSVSFEEAVYLSLAATALQSVRRTEPLMGEYGTVLGLGIVGNLAAQLYQVCGARVLAWDSFPRRIQIARRCGIRDCANFKIKNLKETTAVFAAPYGLDFANFAFGGGSDATPTYEQIYHCMKRSPDTHAMGRIILVGGCKIEFRGGAYSGNIDIRASSRTGPGYHDDEYEHGNDYPNAFVPFTTQRNLRELVKLLAERRIAVRPMTTHRCSIEKIGWAVDRLLSTPNETLGVVIKMPH